MRILDLYCGAGGAAEGYARAGFEVVGIDIADQPNFPFEFYRASAIDVLRTPDLGRHFDAIHASPPCQFGSTVTPDRSKHRNFIPPTRALLKKTGLPYVIENVEGAAKHLHDPVRLCGSSFGLDVRRHRYFETNWPLVVPPCNHAWQTRRFQSLDNKQRKAGKLACVVGVHGNINYPGERILREQAMGIDWMTVHELAEAIPPAYTEFIGRQLAAYLRARE